MLARQLMTYGYAHNDPLSLLMAAKIFAEWEPEPIVPESIKTKSGDKVSQETDPFNVDRLLSDAVKFSGGDAGIQKMADEIAGAGAKGVKGGPVLGVYEIKGQDALITELKFKGDEPAIVAVEGEGNADLDLYVLDKDENVIVADESDSYKCAVYWVPEKTAVYYIVVTNRGNNSSVFAFGTN